MAWTIEKECDRCGAEYKIVVINRDEEDADYCPFCGHLIGNSHQW